jgi:dihydrofolate reductase
MASSIGPSPTRRSHTFLNDLERPVGTYLLGRRTYEVLTYWDDPPALDKQPPFVREFAKIWQTADKLVYSKALEDVSTARTRIERQFDPGAIRQLKAQSERDITVGGPDLAAQAIRAMLVDEYHIFVVPVVVGGRHAVYARQRPYQARTAGRTAVRQWHRLSSLPRADVTT